MDNDKNQTKTIFMCATQLQRIADSMAEVIRLVKEDQEKFTARESRERLQKDD